IEAIGAGDRKHEIMARRVHINVEQYGMLYTAAAELKSFGDIRELADKHNRNLYYKHSHRTIEEDKGHVFIRGYEEETATIVKMLQAKASGGLAGYSSA
ncbi:hypothetical protein, partial [Stenotrophomonas maltophilia]